MRRIGTRGAVALLLALPPAAAGTETAAADAAGIIDRYVDAIGGDARNRGIVSLGAVGRFEMPERKLSGIVELYAKAPDRRVSFFAARTAHLSYPGLRRNRGLGARSAAGSGGDDVTPDVRWRARPTALRQRLLLECRSQAT